MKWLILLSLVLAGKTFAQSASQIEALTKRIEQLESQQEELLLGQSREGHQVNSFLNDNLTLGGFFESAVSTLDGPDTRFQAMNTSNIIGLNIAAEFSNEFRFVSQLLTGLTNPISNPHNDPFATPDARKFGDYFFGALLSQGYVEYSMKSSLRVQAGMGYVPFGYYPQQRELVLFVRRGGPQLLRTNDLFSALWTGLHLSGDFSTNRSGFNLYTMNPLDDTNVLGGGGRIWTISQNEMLGAGFSTQILKYEGHTSEVIGSDIRLNWKLLTLTAEYAIHMTEDEDPWTIYIEPTFRLSDHYLIYTFVDYARSTRNVSSPTRVDPYTKWEFGGGFNWTPTAFTRLRAGLTFNDYTERTAIISGQDRDFISFDFSAGVAF